MDANAPKILRDLLDSVRSRLRLRTTAAGAARVLRDAVALGLATLVLDLALEPPHAIRLVLAGTSMVVVGLSAWRHLVKKLSVKPSDDAIALLVEKANPALEDRLISSLQLGRELAADATTESRPLIEATIRDTVAAAGTIDVVRAVPMGPVGRPALMATAVVLVAVTVGALKPDWATLWVDRWVFLRDTPWPKDTTLRLVVTDEERYAKEEIGGRVVLHVPERTPLQVQVEALGVVPDEVELVIAPVDDPSAEAPVAMGRAAGKGWFQHNFPPLDRSIVIWARGGDDRDEAPAFEIRVDRAPRVTGVTTALEFPAYTGLAPRSGDERNLTIPEGTKVSMDFRVNLDLESFELAFEKGGAVKLTPGTDGVYRHAFTASVGDFYTWRLRATTGVPSADVPRYVLTVAADAPPRLSMESPASTAILATPDAVIPFRGIATDDHGISALEIRWARTEEGLPNAIPFAADDFVTDAPNPGKGTGKRLPFAADVDVSRFTAGPDSRPGAAPVAVSPEAPRAEDRIRFRLLLSDNRVTPDKPEPQRQYGDAEYAVDVKPRAEVERDLAQKQTRLRDRVRDLVRLAEIRLAETEDVLAKATSGGDGVAPDAVKALQNVETSQSRLSAEIAASARQFARVFDGYLYNRLDPGPLTNRLLANLLAAWRAKPSEDGLLLYGRALEDARPLAGDAQLMGRLVNILDLFIKSATTTSPEAARRLGQAALAAAPEARLAEIRAGLAAQKSLVEDLRVLEDRLLAWEDYLDVVQGLQDLIELQKGIRSKAEKLSTK